MRIRTSTRGTKIHCTTIILYLNISRAPCRNRTNNWTLRRSYFIVKLKELVCGAEWGARFLNWTLEGSCDSQFHQFCLLLVGAAGDEPALFTIMDEIYNLARHHHRRCAPKFSAILSVTWRFTVLPCYWSCLTKLLLRKSIYF